MVALIPNGENGEFLQQCGDYVLVQSQDKQGYARKHNFVFAGEEAGVTQFQVLDIGNVGLKDEVVRDNGVAYFSVEVTPRRGEPCVVQKRYNDFDNLASQLDACVPLHGEQLRARRIPSALF